MNKNWEFRPIAVSPAIVCLAFLLCTPHHAFTASPDARQIVAAVYNQDTSKGTSMRAMFEVYDKRGRSKKKEFSYRRLGTSGGGKTLVVFTNPEEIRGVALLSINQRGAENKQYMYTPATHRIRSVIGQERSARFIGTDFTFEDVQERVLDDFSYRLLSDAEVMEGHKTYKIEAKPADASRSQYGFIYYWIAQDVPVILHSEMYDIQGREVRVLHATQVKSVSEIWGARRTEMRTVADGTRTVLVIDRVKFNVNLDASLFTPQGLEATQETAWPK